MEHLQFKHKARVGLEPPTGKLLCSKVKASFLADSTEKRASQHEAPLLQRFPTSPQIRHASLCMPPPSLSSSQEGALPILTFHRLQGVQGRHSFMVDEIVVFFG